MVKVLPEKNIPLLLNLAELFLKKQLLTVRLFPAKKVIAAPPILFKAFELQFR